MNTMELTKAQWTTDGDKFNIDMPLTKIDKENRIVSGWASLDNDDRQGDRVTAEASLEAFKKFAGNIREMHQKVAVGRMVSYRPDTYIDAETGKTYNGIWVDAYISKGAPNTWEKVCDGTLRAFSIKGPIKDYTHEISKNNGKSVRVVKAYDMEELSIVDEGGNQLANIVSIMKDIDGEMKVSGIDTVMNSENVFYCSKDSVAKTSNEESVECPNGHSMERVGWIEYDDEVSKSNQIGEILAKYNATQEIPATTEGGVDVAKEEEKKEAVVDPGSTAPAENAVTEGGQPESEKQASVEKAAAVEEVTEEPKGEAEVEAEKAALVPEVEAEDEPDFAKTIDGFKTEILAVLEKNSTDARNVVEETKAVLEKAVASFDEKFEALSKSHGELTTKFEGIESELKSVEKSLAAVESDTAVKKSGDLGGSKEATLEKSKGSSKNTWGGSFLGSSALEQD